MDEEKSLNRQYEEAYKHYKKLGKHKLAALQLQWDMQEALNKTKAVVNQLSFNEQEAKTTMDKAWEILEKRLLDKWKE